MFTPCSRHKMRHEPQTMRTFQITLAAEMIVLGALLLLASAAVAMAIAGFEASPAPSGDDACRDERGSLGQAAALEELLRKREREEEQRLRHRESGPGRRAAGILLDGNWGEHRTAARTAPRGRPRHAQRRERDERGERQLSPG